MAMFATDAKDDEVRPITDPIQLNNPPGTGADEADMEDEDEDEDEDDDSEDDDDDDL